MDAKTSAAEARIPLSELVYLIYFAVMFGARATGLFEGMLIYNVTLVAGMLIFGCKILMTNHSIFEYLWMCVLLCLAFVVYFCSGEKGILLYFTMMLGMKEVSTSRTMRVGRAILGISFPLLTVLSLTGVLDELSRMNERTGLGFMLRHALGYPYPNTMHTTYLILVMLILYLYQAPSLKHLLFVSLLLMAGNCYLYFMAFSNTGFISVTFYLCLHFFLMWRGKLGKPLSVLAELVFPLTVAFSVLGPILITGDGFRFMNKLLHNRYKFARYFLENERITLFGSRFSTAPTNWYMIDNAFLYLFLQLGVVTFVVVCLIQLVMIHWIIRENRLRELAIILTFCLIGMSDPFLYNLGYKNISFLFAGECLFLLSPQIERRLPALLQTRCRIIAAGGNEVSLAWRRSLSDLEIRIMAHLQTHVRRYLLIFAVAALLGGGAYAILVKEPSVLYVDEWTNDPYNKRSDSVYISEEEYAALSGSGSALFEDYVDGETPMHQYEGTAPRWEYLRGIVSGGLFVGAAAACAVLWRSIRIRRKGERT